MVLILYYGFIALVYYPGELLTLLLGKKNKFPPGVALQPVIERTLMGAAKAEPTAAYLSRYQPPVAGPGYTANEIVGTPGFDEGEDSSFFMVASEDSGTPVIEISRKEELSPEGLLLGNVSDLMESVQTLLRVIEDGEGNSDDVRNFFPSLLAQYPLIADSKYRYSINQYIHDNCKAMLNDSLSLEEVNGLWNFPYPQQAA
ncbi:MAG: hypothetical protein EOP56_02735 [Sphingobacteriales bacterium]|nr:MAG: hypothetical protein EOP56_02735 [Sphingobacteriales bacterium]